MVRSEGPGGGSSEFLGDPPPDPRFLASLGALSLIELDHCSLVDPLTGWSDPKDLVVDHHRTLPQIIWRQTTAIRRPTTLWTCIGKKAQTKANEQERQTTAIRRPTSPWTCSGGLGGGGVAGKNAQTKEHDLQRIRLVKPAQHKGNKQLADKNSLLLVLQ
jgi:hypothetical protein